MFGSVLVVSVAAIFSLAGQALASAPSGPQQAPAVSRPGNGYAYDRGHADFDGNGFTDLAVAAQGESIGARNAVADAGVVHVIYGTAAGLNTARAQTWSQDSTGVPDEAEAGDEFGWALASGDFNADGFTDLAIGTPFEDLGPDQADAGTVTVLYGSRQGLTARGSRLWTQDSAGIAGHAEAEDRFGYALAVGDFGRSRHDDLAVGVPRERAPGTDSRDGGVNLLYGSAVGLRALNDRLLSPTRGPLRGVSAPGARWGATLAAANFGRSARADLAVGAPLDTSRSTGEPWAGSVTVLYGSTRGLAPRRHQRWSQDTPGVADGSEIGAGTGAEQSEFFGFALAAADLGRSSYADLAIGVPGEIIGYTDGPPGSGAGAVNVLYGSPAGLESRGSQFWSQDSPNIAGYGLNSAMDGDISGDDFGFALAVGNFGHTEHHDLAVGVPGESGYNDMYTGGLNVIYGGPAGLTADGNQYWDQGSPGVPGDPYWRDSFGSTLTAGNIGPEPYDAVVIGVAGDDVGPVEDAGAVNILYGSPSGLSSTGSRLITQTAMGAGNIAEPGDLFGSTLQSD